MSVDLKQFHQVFIEESIEGLDAMESALMDLDVACIDDEVINTIFRSAHSIKGGGGTFGFSALAGFTHILETLLDDVRSGRRELTTDQVDLLLKSVDCMREMLVLIQEERNEYTPTAIKIQAALELVLSKSAAPENIANALATESDNEAKVDTPEMVDINTMTENHWTITFKPSENIIRTGNDPLKLIRELCNLGQSNTISLLGNIPGISEYNEEICYFGWKIELVGDAITEADIREIFEWVEDECELIIERQDLKLLNNSQEKSRWSIHFSPYPPLFQTGNDPLRIFKELFRIGKIAKCDINTHLLPSLELLDSEKCYLSWDLEFVGAVNKSQIEEVFEWVIGEGDIRIEEMPMEFIEHDTRLASSVDAKLTAQQFIDLPPKFIQQGRNAAKNNPVGNISEVTPSNTKAVAENHNDLQTANSAQAVNNSAPAVDTSNLKSTQKKSAPSEASSIRVGIDKIDSLINMVGELVITQSMLGQLGSDFDIKNLPKLIEGLNQLEQNTRELQESVMRIRMLPISFAFSRFPRMVRDLGQSLGKKIDLVLIGENTELDKTVMEKIGDPLVHLVRNSVDHGIETSADRLANGKPEMGTVTLNAFHQGGNVIIEIMDDGRGLDRELLAAKGIERGLLSEVDLVNYSDEQIFDLIFQPGFSTAKCVSDLSGRGVGMDVVKRNIQALNGVVEIQSKKGLGTKIRISLPLTLAILDGQLVRVGKETYIFPLVSIVESMQYREELVNYIAGGCSVFKLREEYVPIVDLARSFGYQKRVDCKSALMVVVECDGFKVGMLVDELMAQQQVVIKSLEQNYKRIEGVSGATILGDGTVALIIDVPGVVRLAGAEQLVQQHSLRKSA
jgi:two-component system chemotaxis sensor kinase CheA